MTRTSATRSLLLATAAVALLSGCSSDPDQDTPGGIVIYDAGPAGAPDGAIIPNKPVMTGEIAPIYGFKEKSARVEYYYLGEVDTDAQGKIPLNAIYFFYDETGRPLFTLDEDGTKLMGWHPVVNVVPTKQGYSPFWRVHKVRVKGTIAPKIIEDLKTLPEPAETCQMDAVCTGGKKCIEEKCREPITIGVFDLDGIKSEETLLATKLVFQRTDTILNCPVVDADAKLLKGLADPDKPFPKIQLWYKRLKAFCVLMEGGKALLGAGAGNLPAGKVPAPVKAYFIRQSLSFGTDMGSLKPCTKTADCTAPGETCGAEGKCKFVTLVQPKRHLVLTEDLPGSAGYSPLVEENTAFVDKEHEFKDLRSVAEAKSAGITFIPTGKLHNLVVRGTIPACKDDTDCANTGGKVDPPLKCSIEEGYCSPPFAKLHEECRRGVKECDPKGGPAGGRLGCWGLRVREKYFCLHTCDSDKDDGNPEKDIDTRCGSVRGFQCYGSRRSDPSRPNGLCVKSCNSRAGSLEAKIKECASPTCGDGKQDYGETCDDGNLKGPTKVGTKSVPVAGDGCNEFCTLSTFARCDADSECKGTEDKPPKSQTCQAPTASTTNTYCWPPNTLKKVESEEKNKYRVTCTQFDWCWPPDERADWLGKKETN